MGYTVHSGAAIEPPSYILINGICVICGKSLSQHVAVYVTSDEEPVNLGKMGLKECAYESGTGPKGDWARFVCRKIEKKPDPMDSEEFAELYSE